eukprot:g486.t1
MFPSTIEESDKQQTTGLKIRIPGKHSSSSSSDIEQQGNEGSSSESNTKTNKQPMPSPSLSVLQNAHNGVLMTNEELGGTQRHKSRLLDESTMSKVKTLDFSKVLTYFRNKVKETMSMEDIDRPTYFKSVKTFSQLGQDIYGFRWSTTSFQQDHSLGSREDRTALLCVCLRAILKIANDHAKDQDREAKGSFIAFTACLHLIAELVGVVTTVFLFLDQRTWEAWTFVSVSVASRLFQLSTILFLQKGKCTDYLGALSGITVMTDGYHLVRQRSEYDAPLGEVEFGITAALRKVGTATIQLIPQTIVNISVIVRMLEGKEKIGGLFWVQIISISCNILAFGISIAEFNNDIVLDAKEKKLNAEMTDYIPPDSETGKRQLRRHLISDLPLDKLKAWLMTEKNSFLIEPPPWLTEHWLSLIPSSIRKQIWTENEMLDLKDSIQQVSDFKPVPTKGKTSFIKTINVAKKRGPNASNTTVFPQGTNSVQEPLQGDDEKVQNKIKQRGQLSVREARQKSRDARQSIREVTRKSGTFTGPSLPVENNITTVDDDIDLPDFLKEFLSPITERSGNEINKAVESALDQDFAKSVIDWNGRDGEDNFPAMVVGSLIKHFRETEAKQKERTNLTIVIVSAFLET